MGFLNWKLQFVQWIREIAQQQKGELMFQTTALFTLQEVVEVYVVKLFQDANLCAIHTKRLG